MADLFDLSNVFLQSFERKQLADRISYLPALGRADATAIDGFSGFHASSISSALVRQIGDIDRLFTRTVAAADAVNTARDTVTQISDLLRSATAIGESALTTNSGSGPATATGGTSLLDDAVVDVLGSQSLPDDAAVAVTGSVSKTADAAATVTGTVNIGSSTNLTTDTSVSAFQTLTVDVGGAVTTITFGILPGQVNTAAALESSLDAITGISADYDVNGYLVLTGADADTSFTVGGTADIEAAFGIAEQAYDPVNLLSQGVTQGQTLTFDVGGAGVQTITFGTGTGEVSTLAELDTALAGVTGLTASIDGSNRLAFTANSVTDTVTVGGTADIQTAFGIVEQTYSPTDLLDNGFVQGDTLTFQVGGGAIQEIVFGTGGSEVSTIAELNTALAGLTGLTASLDGSNRLTFSADSARDSVTVGGTVDAQARFGVIEQTYNPTNLLSQGVSQSQTLTIQVGAAAVQTITFGTGDGEIATLAELDTALAGLSGLSASIDGSNRLTFTADIAGETVTVGGSADIEAAFGLVEQTYETGAGTDRLDLQDQYNALVVQIDGLISDAAQGGANFLAGNRSTVRTGSAASDVYVVNGREISAASLGIDLVGGDGFLSDATVNESLAALTAAIGTLDAVSSNLDADYAVLTARSNFFEDLSGLLGDSLSAVELSDYDGQQAYLAALETATQVAALFRDSALGAGDVFRIEGALASEDPGRAALGSLSNQPQLLQSLLASPGSSLETSLVRTITIV